MSSQSTYPNASKPNRLFLLAFLISFVSLISFSGSTQAKAKGEQTVKKQASTAEATVAEAQISFWDLPYLKAPFFDPSPEDRNDALAVGELVHHSGNQSAIMQLAYEMADKKHGEYDSLLISRDGKLVFESYFLRGRINLLHQQASATKTYTGLVLGRAIQLGYLSMEDLHKPIVSFLKDLQPEKFVKGVEKLTLHQALTMRGGISIPADKWKQLRQNRAALKGQGFVQVLLENTAPITAQSQRFEYGNFNPELVMQVIDALVPGGAKAFIKNELLAKIGITLYRWPSSLDGLPGGGGPSYLTSRDMLKLGSLVINQGKWKGEQLISQEFLAIATQKLTKATADWHPKNFNYGYLFYQTDILVGNKTYSANIAWGGGGQHLVMVKELDLIVAITGHDAQDAIFSQVAQRLLPALVQ